MADRPRVFLDTGVLIAAALSETGGARMILKLGEAGLIHLLIGPRVLKEADAVLARKAPEAKPLLAILLDVAGVEVGKPPRQTYIELANNLITYAPDAHVLAEAIANESDYFVALDRKHFSAHAMKGLPLTVGTPGECLGWLRVKLAQLESETRNPKRETIGQGAGEGTDADNDA